MLTFWVGIILMVGVALVVVLRLLLGSAAPRNLDADGTVVAVYEKRLQELEADLDAGILSANDAEAVRQELARNLLQETKSGSTTLKEAELMNRRQWWTAGVIAVLLPVLAIVLYQYVGAPEFARKTGAPHGDMSGNEAHMASIETMVERLAGRLEQNPDDAEGWLMLVNSYMNLGRHEQALAAVERLYQLTGDVPVVLVRYADILATVNGGQLAGKPSELIQKALALDPENVIGLWLAGMAASQAGNPAEAIAYWHKVLPLLGDDRASQEEVGTLIARARAQMGDDAPPIPVMPEPEAVAGKGLAVKVSLAGELAQTFKPDDALFIVAKEENGPPIPVAVVRRTAADLPLEVTLDDSQSMMPTRTLSSFARVEVSARVSSSGNAMPQAGDLVSATAVASPGQEEPVTLVIDKKLN